MTRQNLFSALIIYVTLVSIVLGLGAANDQNLYDSHILGGDTLNDPFLGLFIVFFVTYLFRLGTLCLSFKLKSPVVWKKSAFYGVYFSIPFEILAVALAISLWLQQGCTEAGFTSSCGSGGIGLSLLLGLGYILQIIGQLVGRARAKRLEASR